MRVLCRCLRFLRIQLESIQTELNSPMQYKVGDDVGFSGILYARGRETAALKIAIAPKGFSESRR